MFPRTPGTGGRVGDSLGATQLELTPGASRTCCFIECDLGMPSPWLGASLPNGVSFVFLDWSFPQPLPLPRGKGKTPCNLGKQDTAKINGDLTPTCQNSASRPPSKFSDGQACVTARAGPGTVALERKAGSRRTIKWESILSHNGGVTLEF